MSKQSYLAAYKDWVRRGRQGRAPNSADHGIFMSDFSTGEIARAEQEADPRPEGVSSWVWYDSQHHPDLLRWHHAIRRAHRGGEIFTTAERNEADALYHDPNLSFDV